MEGSITSCEILRIGKSPIILSQEMNQEVHVGDVVEAQIGADGQVTSITKAP